MSFELSREHEAVPPHRPRLRREGDRAARRRSGTATTTSRSTSCSKMGELGLFGLTAPEEYGGAGRGRRLHQPVRGDRGDRPRRPVAGHHPRGRGRPRHQPDPRPTAPTSRSRPGCPTSSPGDALAGFGLTEPGRRLRRRRDPHQAELDDGEWVVDGAKQFITNSGSEITSLVTVTARTGDADDGKRRDLDDHRAGRHAGLHRREGLRQARLARLRHPPADVRGRPRARGQPARRARPRLRAVPRHPRRRPGRDRGARGRLHPGVPRRCASQYAGERHDVRRARSGASRASPSRSPTSR